MEKNAKIELELGDEQLQAITGGCASCRGHAKHLNFHTRQAEQQQALAQDATQLGLTDQALQHEAKASYHIEKAQGQKRKLDELGAVHVLEGWLAAKKARNN